MIFTYTTADAEEEERPRLYYIVRARHLFDPRLQLRRTRGDAATSKDWFITPNESIKIKFETIRNVKYIEFSIHTLVF